MTKYAIIYLYLQFSVKAISPCEKTSKVVMLSKVIFIF